MDWYDYLYDPYLGRARAKESMAFNIYANRKSRIDSLIDKLAAADDPNDEMTQMAAFVHNGFNGEEDLLDSEIRYIIEEVEKRL